MKNFIFILFLLAFSSSAFSKPTHPGLEEVGGTQEEWPNKIKDEINKVSDKTINLVDTEVDGFMRDIGLSVFEELTQFQVYTGKIGNVNIGAKVYRRVFPNHDTFDSHTVIDTFEIPISIPIWGYSEALSSEFNIGLNLGSSGSFKVENIRQVVPKFMKTYPKWEDFSLKKAFFEGLKPKNLLKFFNESYGYTEEELEELNNYLDGERSKISEGEWLEDDRDRFYLTRKFKNPASKARYGKLLNIFTSPLKLPVKAEHVKKLHHGEIVSYTANGLIQLGGSIGWSYSLTGIVDPIGGQLSKTTYLNGRYRVSIINEDDRFVKVKVSRLEAKGINTTFYPLTVKKTLLDGLAVIGIDLEQSVVMTPFQFTSNNSAHKQFDIIYRYDLEQDAGARAYEKAVWGLLKDSENLSLIEAGVDSPAVEKIISKTTFGETVQKYKKFEINFVFKATSNKRKTLDHSIITIPSGPDKGTHYVKNGSISRVKEWSSLWNFKERKEEAFRVSLNEERLKKGDLRGFGLTVEMNSYDNKTTGRELNTYLEKCQDIIGFDGVNAKVALPAPLKEPEVNDKGEVTGLKKAWYGESRFLCKAQYDWFHLQRFIYTSNEEKIEILEKAMGLVDFKQRLTDEGFNQDTTRYLTSKEERAKTFLNNWKRLEKTSDDYDLLHKTLTEMINTNKKSYDVARVLQLACTERVVPYIVRAYNEVFDHINLTENTFHQVDNISGKAAAAFAVDIIGPRTKYDSSAVVSGVSSKVRKNGNLIISFHLNSVPKFVYLDLQGIKYDATRLRAKLVIENRGEFTAGLNQIKIRPGGDRRIARFFSYLEEGMKYNLGVSHSRNGINWGGLSSHEFFYRKPKHVKEEDKEEGPF